MDVDDLRARAVPPLREASALARSGVQHTGKAAAPLPHDLAGRDLRTSDLRGADLRGALLVGADLRGLDLDRADVTGADLRAARVHGTDLRATLFLTPLQVAAAHGDRTTRLPDHLDRPGHWTSP